MTLHRTLGSWLDEAAKRIGLGHTLIPADDPSFEGPWHAPTRYPAAGFADQNDEDDPHHLLELSKIKAGLDALTPEQRDTWTRIRNPRGSGGGA